MKLRPGENVVTSAVLDENHGIGYFATAESDFKYSLEQASATLIRINLRHFSRIEDLKLPPGNAPLRAGIINKSGSHAYFGIYGDPNKGTPARVIGISLILWAVGPHVSLGKDDFGVSSGVMDPNENMGYFGTLFGSVVGVHLPDVQLSGSLSLQKEDNAFQCAVVDPQGQFAYFGTSTGNVMKVDLHKFDPIGNITVFRVEKGFRAAAISPAGDFAYFGTEESPARIARIRLADFVSSGTSCFRLRRE